MIKKSPTKSANFAKIANFPKVAKNCKICQQCKSSERGGQEGPDKICEFCGFYKNCKFCKKLQTFVNDVISGERGGQVKKAPPKSVNSAKIANLAKISKRFVNNCKFCKSCKKAVKFNNNVKSSERWSRSLQKSQYLNFVKIVKKLSTV